MTAHTIYTIGYQERSLEAFLGILQEAGVAVLVDVRDNPWSRKKGFSKNALAEALEAEGITYIHAGFAGNPKFIRKELDDHAAILARYRDYVRANPAVFEQLTDLLMPHLQGGKNPCLMCYERHPDDCHRSILAEGWTDRQELEVEIVHLAPHGARRFVDPDDEGLFGGSPSS